MNTTRDMGLDTEEIRKRIQERTNGATISQAIRAQNRIKFHAQTEVSPYLAQPLTDFLGFVNNLIPEDKFRIFKTLFRFPVKTNEVTRICFDKLSRIFDGKNPAYNYQFLDSDDRDDWENYRHHVLGEPGVWEAKGWEFFKTEINSVLVVDLPEEQDTEDRYPQPYFYWLPISDVIAYEADKNTGVMDWIIFQQGEGKVAVFDDERYRVIRYQDGKLGEVLIDNAHDLGYCPARFFWDQPVNLRQPDIKASPLTDQLEALDWYLFQHISKRHLDLYASYPIYSGYEQSCDYSNEQGDYCDGGYLKDKQGYYKLDGAGILARCPKCGNKRIAGVGSFVEIPVPDGEKQPDLRNPVQMLTVDRNSLDYNVAEEIRLKEDIINAVVGRNATDLSKAAVNEKQVKAVFEDRDTILRRVKKGFEAAQLFVDSTICRLRYGSSFVSASINLGTEFYVLSPEELRLQYVEAKKGGASEAELDAMQTQIIETAYRTDPTQKQRMLLLAELEPYRHLTREEVVALYDKGLISDEELKMKLNFTSFIRRFERENMNILEFGSAIPYPSKIKVITDKLLDYARENRGRQGEGRQPE